MEKSLKNARNLVNKIVNQIGRSDIDWTVQLSINSIEPNKVNYCAQIESPANGLQPITWVTNSMEQLIKELEEGVNALDAEAVQKAWHLAEIKRAEALIKYHKKELEES